MCLQQRIIKEANLRERQVLRWIQKQCASYRMVYFYVLWLEATRRMAVSPTLQSRLHQSLTEKDKSRQSI